MKEVINDKERTGTTQEREVAIRITEETLRSGLPAPEIQYTKDGIHVTLQIDDETGTKSISLRGEVKYEDEMLSYIIENVRFLRPSHQLRLTEDEAKVIKRNIDYIKSKVDEKRYDVARVFFMKATMTNALIRYGNIEHEVYLHSTKEELENIIKSFLEQEYFCPLTIAQE